LSWSIPGSNPKWAGASPHALIGRDKGLTAADTAIDLPELREILLDCFRRFFSPHRLPVHDDLRETTAASQPATEFAVAPPCRGR
jgi:hypothetical protein